jgi:adenine phosphoribosyltransferase
MTAPLDADLERHVRSIVRTIPDWPNDGVQFRDVTPLFASAKTFRSLVEVLCGEAERRHAQMVVGIDARGFIVGAAMALELGLGFVPVRKEGKLPSETIAERYDLEYGSAAVELHVDALENGMRVAMVDDLIATGGTMLAAHRLVDRLGASVVGAMALIDLPDLGGSAALAAAGLDVFTLLTYSGD